MARTKKMTETSEINDIAVETTPTVSIDPYDELPTTPVGVECDECKLDVAPKTVSEVKTEKRKVTRFTPVGPKTEFI